MGNSKKGKGRKPKRKFARAKEGKFARAGPAAAATEPSEPLDDSTLSPMEVDEEPHDDQDEDWHAEDTGAASGGGQAKLSFGSAAAAASAATGVAHVSYPEVAPPRAAQPCRQTLHRRREASRRAAVPKMAHAMASWLAGGAKQQSQQSSSQSSETQRAAEPLRVEEDNSSVPAAACTAERGSDCGGGESNSDSNSDRDSDDSCSETDMLVEDGAGLPLMAWYGEVEQEAAQGALEEHCDDGYFSCGGFLDGHDYPSSMSSGSLGSEGSDAEIDGDAQPRGTSVAAAMGNGCEQSGGGFGGDIALRGASGTAAIDGCNAAGATSAAAAPQPATAVRRSSRETSSMEYFPPRRASAERAEYGGTGRGVRKLMPDEVQAPLLGLKRKKNKAMRVDRKIKVRLVGKVSTKEQRARQARRTRRHCSERRNELVEIFRKALDKINQVCV